MMETYDTIVIGCGGVGSATLYQLAKRGQRVLALDRFPKAHSHGSSHGQTRIIRQAYFEHPDYVPLLLRTYELWRELETATNTSLFKQVGLLEVGPADGILIPGVMQSVKQHGLAIERLSASEASARFPFLIPAEQQIAFETTAGYLLVEECVRAHLAAAVGLGATWKQEVAIDWSASNTSVQVTTADATYSAGSIVICGGAWSSSLLHEVGVQLTVREKHQYWFAAPPQANNMPTFFFETSQGEFYGIPQIGQSGIKIAQHTGGRKYNGPFDVSSARDETDLEQVRAFAAAHLNFKVGPLLSRQACMYTNSPDQHFVIDQHPQHPNVVFASGLSGHGFKFTAVLGAILAQLTCGAEPELAIDFLRLSRFQ